MGINQAPVRAIPGVVASTAGGHQVQSCQFGVVSVQVTQHLATELAHLATGNNAYGNHV